MIYCTCDVSMLDSLLRALEAMKVEEYEVYDKVVAKSRKGDPRLNTPIWPGYNASVMVSLGDEQAGEVIRRIQQMNREVISENEWISVYSWEVERND